MIVVSSGDQGCYPDPKFCSRQIGRRMLLRNWFLASLASMALMQAATAAPFCVSKTGLPLQCLYMTAEACSAQLSSADERCVPDPTDVSHVFGNAQFCLATQDHIQSCLYTNLDQCEADAPQRHGVCYDNLHGLVLNPNQPEAVQ